MQVHILKILISLILRVKNTFNKKVFHCADLQDEGSALKIWVSQGSAGSIPVPGADNKSIIKAPNLQP
jgi:hypothetical protein